MALSPCSSFLTRSRMLANGTFTLEPFCFKQGQGCWQTALSPWSPFSLSKVRDVGKLHFHLGAVFFFNKVKDVGKCNFHLGATFLTRSRMLANATFTLTPFFKQGQGCWQMPLSPWSHFLFNKVKDVDRCHFHLGAIF